MESHVKAVGIIHIAFSVLGVLIAIAIFTVLNVVAKMPDVEEEATRILQIIGMVIPWFIIVCSLPGLVGGIGISFGNAPELKSRRSNPRNHWYILCL